MNTARFEEITAQYRSLRLAVVGDFCLDRYLEIDPVRAETSIETGLDVHNVVNVRSQPGAAGTILNNLVALGVGELWLVGFCGDDGEGYELQRALQSLPGVRLDHFLQTDQRRTFTYCKPLVVQPGEPPRELNRLDSKNWSPTPPSVRQQLTNAFRSVTDQCNAVILMDQVDVAETGVVTSDLLTAVRSVAERRPELLMLADSRRSLQGWPPVCLKMNAAELVALTGQQRVSSPAEIEHVAAALAKEHRRSVFITLSERGMVAAQPTGESCHLPTHPVRGAIDIVGAGDAVTANLTAALAAGAEVREASQLAMAAASIVIHQLGTTGTASVAQQRALLFGT